MTLYEWRSSEGLSQEEVATRLKTSKQRVSQLESKANPSMDMMDRAARLTRNAVTPNDWLRQYRAQRTK